MSKETKCPVCGAGPRGDYIFGVNLQWWECNNNEDLLEFPKLQPDECRIRELENKLTVCTDAWTGMRDEILYDSDFSHGVTNSILGIIDGWEVLL